MKKLKVLTKEDIKISFYAEYEQTSPKDSFDMSMPESVDIVRDINSRLASGDVWAWFTAEVIGTYKGLKAKDYLGGCSYKDKKDFEQGDYYEDMIQTVLDSLNEQLKELFDDLLIDEEPETINIGGVIITNRYFKNEINRTVKMGIIPNPDLGYYKSLLHLQASGFVPQDFIELRLVLDNPTRFTELIKK